MRFRRLAIALAALGFSAGTAAAQVAWDSPMLSAPDGDAGFGVFIIEPAGGDLGAMVTWRGAPAGFGLRGGLAEDAGDDIALFGGVDFIGNLFRHSADFPLDVSWVLGAGGSVGNNALISIPGGLTLGRSFSGDGITFTPYVTPRLVLDVLLADEVEDDTELEFVADLGLDLQFQPNWAVRFGVTLGDRDEALAIGVAF